MVKVKGNLLYQYRKKFIEHFHKEKFKELIGKVSVETKKILEGSIMSSNWYEIEVLEELLNVISKEISIEEMEHVAEEVANEQSLFFGFVFKTMKPEKVIEKAEFIWGKLFDEGIIESSMDNERIFVKISNFKISEAHNIMIRSYIKKIAENTMKKEIKAESKRINDSTVQYIYTYK